MRQLSVVVATLLAVASACRDVPPAQIYPGVDAGGSDAGTGPSDAGIRPSDGGPSDGPGGGPTDGPAGVSDGIAAARAAADGTGLSLAIHGATVTYEKPQIGSLTNDPAGFTVQAVRPGPALFVAVDPATLTPAPAIGDVVDFTITAKATVNGEPRAQAITGLIRHATGIDIRPLAQDVSAAADLVSGLDSYDAELITVTGTLTGDFGAAGTGFQRATMDTTGIVGNTNLQLRVPATLVDAIDMVKTCRVTATDVVMGKFFTAAQIGAFTASDVAMTGCPAPIIVSALAESATSVRLTFSRHIDPRSVIAGGSQFTLDHGLTAKAVQVSGRSVTITTTAQSGATIYAVAVASSVTDLLGTPVADTSAAAFAGFQSGQGVLLSVHTTLGLPSPVSTLDLNSFLSVKPEYVVSYNSGRKVPNWVSWELNTSYLGSTARQDDYRPDDTLPVTLPQAQLADYSGSGYDRGHMCPSADRTLTVAANSDTFFLTNMVPQAANNNQGPWNDLENECRTLARAGKELFIISGGTFSATSNLVGSGVVVPDETFKVIVVLDAVGQGPADVTANTRVIAVLMPNENVLIGQSTPWRNFRVSVDSIEALTGYDFLSDVDPAVQAVVEARVDNQ
ncbi:MAG TPA: DNA/RNA non-specific endonuclease [Kofleriaceae bacterium]